MNLRECTLDEAKLAATLYGVASVHELKKGVLGQFNSISESDVYVDKESGEIFIYNKDEHHYEQVFVNIFKQR